MVKTKIVKQPVRLRFKTRDGKTVTLNAVKVRRKRL